MTPIYIHTFSGMVLWIIIKLQIWLLCGWTYMSVFSISMYSLFNDASRAHRFSYGQLLGIKHRGNVLLPHSLLFPISSKGSFICIFPLARTPYHSFNGPVIDQWLERKIAQTENVLQERSAMQEDTNLYNWVLYRLSYVLPPRCMSWHNLWS